MEAKLHTGVEGQPGPSAPTSGQRIAFHSPCSLQHGQKLPGLVEGILIKLGFELTPVADGHLCCGSAGSYSLLQPELSRRLRDNKLASLSAGEMSSDSMQSGRTSRGSGTHSPSLASIPRAHRFNPMAVSPSASRGPVTRRRRASKHDDFSDDDDDYAADHPPPPSGRFGSGRTPHGTNGVSLLGRSARSPSPAVF